MEELLVSSLAQTDALAKLLIEKGLITRERFPRNEQRIRSSLIQFDTQRAAANTTPRIGPSLETTAPASPALDHDEKVFTPRL
jgi:hypothetical protein